MSYSYRRSDTGRYCTEKYADAHRKTTEREKRK